MLKPLIKAFVKKEIENEEYQKVFTEKVLEKVDLPKLTKAQEKKFLDSIYDATQEILLDYINEL